MLVCRSLMPLRVAVALFAAFAIAACTKNIGEAVVLEKEHIDAAEPSPTPAMTLTESAAKPLPTNTPDTAPLQTELAPDEIVVDTCVMKKNLRGTGKDPRAGTEEKWLIKVETVQETRRFTIHSDRAHFLKYKAGDRIRVRYKVGDYTGTVWNATIED